MMIIRTRSHKKRRKRSFLIIFAWSVITVFNALYRSSRPEKFVRKGVLKICGKFTGEQSCRKVISIKLLCNFIAIIFRHWCSPVNLLHIFRTPFPWNTSGRLLLFVFIVFHYWYLNFPYNQHTATSCTKSLSLEIGHFFSLTFFYLHLPSPKNLFFNCVFYIYIHPVSQNIKIVLQSKAFSRYWITVRAQCIWNQNRLNFFHFSILLF